LQIGEEKDEPVERTRARRVSRARGGRFRLRRRNVSIEGDAAERPVVMQNE
jgi:hypothetical protein